MPAKNETLIQDVDPNFAVVPAGTLIPEMVPLHNRLISYKEFLPGESLTSWLLRLPEDRRREALQLRCEAYPTRVQSRALHQVFHQGPPGVSTPVLPSMLGGGHPLLSC